MNLLCYVALGYIPLSLVIESPLDYSDHFHRNDPLNNRRVIIQIEESDTVYCQFLVNVFFSK